MLRVAKDLDTEQVPVESSDMTAALLRTSDRVLLVVSVHVEGRDGQALIGTCHISSKLGATAIEAASNQHVHFLPGNVNKIRTLSSI